MDLLFLLRSILPVPCRYGGLKQGKLDAVQYAEVG